MFRPPRPNSPAIRIRKGSTNEERDFNFTANGEWPYEEISNFCRDSLSAPVQQNALIQRPAAKDALPVQEFAGSHSRSLFTSKSKLKVAMGTMVNQVGALCLAEITVYENGDVVLSELGSEPRAGCSVFARRQLAVYQGE